MVILYQKLEMGLTLHTLKFPLRRNYLLKIWVQCLFFISEGQNEFYSKLIPSETTAEIIRSKNICKKYANTSRESLNFDFGLNNTFCDADDLSEF